MSKTLYHSNLVKLGEVTAVIKSEPTKSKYEGKSPFVVLEIEGEEKLYNCENERCEGRLMLRKGQVLTLRATGSREDADIEILSGGGEQDGNGKDAPAAKPPQAPTVTSTSSNGASSLDALGVSFYAALGKSDDIISQFFTEEQRSGWSAYEAADLTLRVAAGLSIEANRAKH